MVKRVKVSVVIPLESKSNYLFEALASYQQQTYTNFEVIVSSNTEFKVKQKFVKLIVDKNLVGDPSSKRNKVIKYGAGDIIIFNDDDVFVPPRYLERVVKQFENPEVYGAGGPLLTPPSDDLLKSAGGLVWESFVGSMGAGVFRSRKMKPRIVYDYPAANLIIRRDTFLELGGFEPGMYPGEDTKLCLLLSEKYNTGIYYNPNLYVYHHRRSLFKNHLQQVGRYGTQRGKFALSYPQTSFTLPYFIPSILLLYFLTLPWTVNYSGIILIPGLLYLGVIIAESLMFAYRKNILTATLMIPAVVATHMYYGYKFIVSFMNKLIAKVGSSV